MARYVILFFFDDGLIAHSSSKIFKQMASDVKLVDISIFPLAVIRGFTFWF